MEAPEALASSTSGVIGEPHLAVNTPRERKMTFLPRAARVMCISEFKPQHLQGFLCLNDLSALTRAVGAEGPRARLADICLIAIGRPVHISRFGRTEMHRGRRQGRPPYEDHRTSAMVSGSKNLKLEWP